MSTFIRHDAWIYGMYISIVDQLFINMISLLTANVCVYYDSYMILCIIDSRQNDPNIEPHTSYVSTSKLDRTIILIHLKINNIELLCCL